MFNVIIKAIEHHDELYAAVAQLSGGFMLLCAFISTLLPPASAPGFYAETRKTINLLGLNVGHAKNSK